MENQGIVFNIQQFSIHDGPGIRTTVFLKGCPLKCRWCSNPESQIDKIQILYDSTKCLHCETCIHQCPQNAISSMNKHILIDFSKCIGCLACVNHCPTRALNHEGEYKSVNEVVDICLKDIDFYEESQGGVTISGGEGMSQPAFLKELIQALKAHNIHVAIETTGYIQPEIFQEIAPMFDLLLFDVKHHDTNEHFKQTGVHNNLIKENLKWAIKNNIEVLPRIPVIPNFNDSLEDAKGLASLLKNLNAKKVQLLPFHQFGEKKYELLNRTYELKGVQALHTEDLYDYRQVFLDENIDCFF